VAMLDMPEENIIDDIEPFFPRKFLIKLQIESLRMKRDKI